MAVALLAVVIIAASMWLIARSARNLKTALMGVGVIMVTEAVVFGGVLLSFPHAHWSTHVLALDGAISALVATPIALISGFIAVQIASRRFRDQQITEVSR